jgi:hypothetical protein
MKPLYELYKTVQPNFLGEIHNQFDNCFFQKLAKLGQFVPKKNPLFMLRLARLFAF